GVARPLPPLCEISPCVEGPNELARTAQRPPDLRSADRLGSPRGRWRCHARIGSGTRRRRTVRAVSPSAVELPDVPYDPLDARSRTAQAKDPDARRQLSHERLIGKLDLGRMRGDDVQTPPSCRDILRELLPSERTRSGVRRK